MGNACTMALEAQYTGLDNGHKLQIEGYTESADDTWPVLYSVLIVLEFFYGITFGLEIILKLFGLRRNFFQSCWNYFDTVVVLSWVIVRPGQTIFVNPLFLRLLRLARLMRLVKLAK